MQNRKHEEKYAKLGYEMYRRVTSAVAEASGDEWCDQIMEEAERIGLARKEQYDPEVHGDGVNAERGDIIWFWEPFVDESILIAAPEELGDIPAARRSLGDEFIATLQKKAEIDSIAQQLALIGDEIRTQNNRHTADVAFFVNVKERIPTDQEFSCCDEWAFHDHGALETYYHDSRDRERWEELSKLHEEDELTEEITAFRYIEVWKTVQVCFTEKAANEHLEYNRHRYTSYHGAEVYGESFYRNPEMLQIRNALIRLSELITGLDPSKKDKNAQKTFSTT